MAIEETESCIGSPRPPQQPAPNVDVNTFRFLDFPFLHLLGYISLTVKSLRRLPLKVILIAVCAVSSPSGTVAQSTTLSAKFNLGGIAGGAKFSQSSLGGDVTLEISIKKGGTLATFNGDVTWELRQQWVDLTVQDKCASAGSRYETFGGSGTFGSEPFKARIPGNSIENVRTLTGRTIYISVQTSNSKSFVACATINMGVGNLQSEYAYYVANMQGDVMGSIWFREIVDGGVVEILTDLYTQDIQNTPAKNYKWIIVSQTVKSCHHVSTLKSYNPLNIDDSHCSSTNPASCTVGDLSGKLGDVPIGSNYGTATRLFHDFSFNITDVTEISSKIIVVIDKNNKVIGCGRIVAVTGKSSAAKFSNDGVFGSLQFSQISPYEYTTIFVSIFNLQSKAAGYHIHVYPVPYKALQTQSLCDATSVGGHFNPYGIKVNPDSKTESLDKYEVGDISGKFGELTGKNDISVKYLDNNLPMFGSNSIMGKSIVIHYTNGSRWVCSNIVEHAGVITAMATFKYPVSGYVLLRQNRNDEVGETSVFVSLDYTDGIPHPEFIVERWLVHRSPVGFDSLSGEEDRCKSTHESYNPINVETGDQYMTQCGPHNQRRCEVGDLTRKLSNSVSIKSGTAAQRKFTFVDTNLPLSGSSSVVGKSIVIYGSGSKSNIRIACANIQEVRTRAAKVDSWSDYITGSIKFSQSSGVIHQFTDINIDLKNLNNIASQYHVHLFPVPTGNDITSPCNSDSVGGHFNPFHVDFAKSPLPAKGSNDQYEVGDLSGKFGLIVNKTSYSYNTYDSNLNVFGVNSIVGRSVVIHKNDAVSSRWVCGTIVQNVELTGGTYIQASATFTDTETTLTGSIRLVQYVYPDGSYSDTNILMDISYPNKQRKTLNHNWHIHENPISGDGKATTEVCKSAGPHYNPYMVNVESGYEKCQESNPLRCELGDQANKVGTYDVGGGKRVFTDIDIPIFGLFSVLGRSFVIHVADGGPGRMACADIKPVHPQVVYLSVKKPSTINKQAILRQYAEALQTETWNLAVIITDGESGCISVAVYFTGYQATQLKSRFEDILKSDKSALGSYGPVVCASVSPKVSTILLIVCLSALFKLLW